MSEADDYPAKCAIRWGMGLVEPLLSVTQRVNDDQAMAELGRTNPAWVRIFFAGVLSNLGGTLPDNDSWRGTSARIGRMAVGPNPPSFDGAVGTDWAPWGTWEDSLGVTESVFSSPDVDPEFAALSEGLLPTAAALAAFSTHGWRLCREALEAAGKTTDGPEEFHQLATSSIRWAAHRRRSYGFPNNDPFLIESFLSWSWRATDVLAGRPVNQEEVDKAIRSERIKTDTP